MILGVLLATRIHCKLLERLSLTRESPCKDHEAARGITNATATAHRSMVLSWTADIMPRTSVTASVRLIRKFRVMALGLDGPIGNIMGVISVICNAVPMMSCVGKIRMLAARSIDVTARLIGEMAAIANTEAIGTVLAVRIIYMTEKGIGVSIATWNTVALTGVDRVTIAGLSFSQPITSEIITAVIDPSDLIATTAATLWF